MTLAFLQESIGLHGKEMDTIVTFKQVWITILCKSMPFSLSKPVPPWLGLDTHVLSEKAVHLCWTIRLCQEADCWAGSLGPLCLPGFNHCVAMARGRGMRRAVFPLLPLQTLGLSLAGFLSLCHKPWIGTPPHNSCTLWVLEFALPVLEWQFGRGEGAELATSPIYWWQRYITDGNQGFRKGRAEGQRTGPTQNQELVNATMWKLNIYETFWGCVKYDTYNH